MAYDQTDADAVVASSLTVEQQAAIDALEEPTPLEAIAAFAAITGDTITTTAITTGATVATGAYT